MHAGFFVLVNAAFLREEGLSVFASRGAGERQALK